MSAEQESPVPAELLSDVLWRREGATSLEHFRLSKIAKMYALNGVVLSWAGAGASPRQIHYAVACDLSWNTRTVHVTVIEGDAHRRLELERDESGAWRRGEEALTGFDGVVDIDLQITPATNTVAIRRLKLGIGAAAEAEALWVRFPDLELERLPQRYTRTAEHRYRYESSGGAFTADLDVDHAGVVVRYGDIWQRVSA